MFLAMTSCGRFRTGDPITSLVVPSFLSGVPVQDMGFKNYSFGER